MKRLLIILLIIIIAFLTYDFYKDWKRFKLPNYQYTTEAVIDANHQDKKLLLDYYKAIERLNGFVITQWTTNEIDVLAPEDDSDAVMAAVNKYNDLRGVVKFYESQLVAPKNEPVENNQPQPKSVNILYEIYTANPAENTPKMGNKGAFVYEIQKLLNKKGDSITEDGVFNIETKNALRSFEEKNNLFADGVLDELTLLKLLE